MTACCNLPLSAETSLQATLGTPSGHERSDFRGRLQEAQLSGSRRGSPQGRAGLRVVFGAWDLQRHRFARGRRMTRAAAQAAFQSLAGSLQAVRFLEPSIL
jgi:hypothetical protein